MKLEDPLSAVEPGERSGAFCREVSADIDVLVSTVRCLLCLLTFRCDEYLQKFLGIPLQDYGKLPVITLANHGHVARFNKFSGILPWRNCVFLWITIDEVESSGSSKYTNSFLHYSEDGVEKCDVVWFGGSKMYSGK